MFISCVKPAAIAAAITVLSSAAAFAQDDSAPPDRQFIKTQEQNEVRRNSGVYRIAEPKAREPQAAAPAESTLTTRILNRQLHFGEWVAAQVFLVICGILATLLALALAPRASTLAVAAIDWRYRPVDHRPDLDSVRHCHCAGIHRYLLL